jgi:hypothetical protein
LNWEGADVGAFQEVAMHSELSDWLLPAQCALSIGLLAAAAACVGSDMSAASGEAAAAPAAPVISPLIHDSGMTHVWLVMP